MIGAEQFEFMRQGSYLINASRGSVVDIQALINASRSGKIAGAALDVYPNEPGGNGDYFHNNLNSWAEDLRSLKNIILTPHIGGSTEEAQTAIGIEVAEELIKYVNEGTTQGAVNLPEVALRSLTQDEPNHVRVGYKDHCCFIRARRLTICVGHLHPSQYSWCAEASERYSRRPQRRQADDRFARRGSLPHGGYQRCQCYRDQGSVSESGGAWFQDSDESALLIARGTV